MASGPVAVTEGFSFKYGTCIQWSKLKNLGMGSYGVVNLVKIISPVSCVLAVKHSSPSSRSSLCKEYRILQHFRGCPNIVQCFDLLTTESEEPSYNLLLDYAPGGDLLNLIKKYGGKIPESHVKSYTRMLLEGLHDIHKRGYVHCDLKPGNILVYPSDQPDSLSTLKIADFGLAKEPGDSDEPTTRPPGLAFRGTARYMSPESVRDGKITAAMDIWSLGCVIVEMMTGNPPWESVRTSEDLATKIALTDYIPNLPQDMSALGKNFLMRCFAKDPRDRWTAAGLKNHPYIYLKRAYFAARTSFLQVPSGETSNPSEIQPIV